MKTATVKVLGQDVVIPEFDSFNFESSNGFPEYRFYNNSYSVVAVVSANSMSSLVVTELPSSTVEAAEILPAYKSLDVEF